MTRDYGEANDIPSGDPLKYVRELIGPPHDAVLVRWGDLDAGMELSVLLESYNLIFWQDFMHQLGGTNGDVELYKD
jgi:hypothetical protein